MSHSLRFQPRRPLGRTGFVATPLGIGDLADRTVPFETCVATARRALDAGLNLIDTAPGYEDGYSEQIVGAAIAGRRDEVFVIDKIDHPEQPVAPQVEGSLEHLQTDRVDLFVFHGVSRLEHWDALLAPGGGMEQLERCRAAGKLRFKGLSSHHPEVLLAALRSGVCDAVLFAVGPFCDSRYIEEVLPLARQQRVGTVCFKTFGAGKLLGDTSGYGRSLRERPRGKVSSGGVDEASEMRLPRLSVSECLHYTLTCDPDVALLGLSFPNEQDRAFEAFERFAPLSSERMADIRRRAAAAVAEKGPCWWNPEPLR